LSDAERRNLRRKLKNSVEVTKDVLNPRNQIQKLVERNKTKAKRVAGDAAETARKNAPLIGAIGLGALLFAARRPISDWISKARKSKTNPSDDE
ncbi:MAG TPA: hypothetical protein VGN36_07795, partial [Sphingorhabdus sp.]|nr:hypothetical protein [Sphingorhabdus sp.]